MYPLSDNELDRLSREAAEQSDVDLRPSGWEQVEQRLNKELPLQKERDRRRFLWLFFILLVAGGSGLVWMLTGKKENNITSKPTIQSAANTDNKTLTPVLTPTNPDPEAIKGNKTANEENSTIADNNTPNTALSRNQKTSPEATLYPENKTSAPNKVVSITRSKNKLPDSKLVADNKEKASRALVINKPKKSDKKQLIHPFDSDPSITQPTVIDQASATVKKSGEPGQLAKPDIHSVSTSASTRIPLTIVTPFIISNNSEKVIPSNLIAGPGTEQLTNGIAPIQKLSAGKSGFKQPLSFGILTGIDYSRIHQTGNNKPGYDIGFQVSYNFSRRWSVNTGFIFTKKNYSALAKDFYPPKHYWTTYVQLTSLEGDCDMWDIPLNVRYNFIVKPGNKWFVNAGTSSYIMRNQAYTYYFVANNYPAQKDWKTGSQQNEWFNIINFSAGFEKALNKTWSLQTEPFVKLPVRGMGFGKMDISSYGIMLGVKYSPAFK